MDTGSLCCQCHKPVQLLQGHNINDLPLELLVKIMSNLSLFHRKRTREVCRYWNDVSYERSLIRNDWMVVPSVEDLKKLEGRHPDRIFTNIRIKSVFYEYEESNVWQKFGPFIQKVEVRSIHYARNPIFAEIVKYCTDIKHLALFRGWPLGRNESCNETASRSECRKSEAVPFAELLPTNALSTLTSVKLERSPIHLTEAIFNSLNRNSQHLTEIVLDGCSAHSTAEYSSISDLLKKQSTKLTHLTLSRISGITDLSDLLSCVGNQLTSLNISSNGTTDECLSKVCQYFPSLEVINLSGCEFTEKGIKMIFTSLKKLSSVYLGHSNLTDYGLKDILCIDNLRKLDLTDCEDITNQGLIDAFNQRPLPKLETLILRDIGCTLEGTVEVITRMAPNITFWDLTCTHADDSDVQFIINRNKALHTLILGGCSNVAEIFSGTPSINDLRELRELDVDDCSTIDYSSIRYLSLRKLEKFSFVKDWKEMYVPSDWDEIIPRLLDVCPALEEVCIYGLEDSGIDESRLSPHALKVFYVSCNCPFSPQEHQTRKCRP